MSEAVGQARIRPLATTEYRLYRSANRGVAGVVYLLARLARHGYLAESARARVGQAVDWLLTHAPTSDDQLPGLHFGEAGVAVALAEAVRSGLIDEGTWLKPPPPPPRGYDSPSDSEQTHCGRRPTAQVWTCPEAAEGVLAG